MHQRVALCKATGGGVCVRVSVCVCASVSARQRGACLSVSVRYARACRSSGTAVWEGVRGRERKGVRAGERGARRGRTTTPSTGRRGGGGRNSRGVTLNNSRAFRNSRERKLPQLVRALPPPLATGLWDGHGGACPPASSGPPAPRPLPPLPSA